MNNVVKVINFHISISIFINIIFKNVQNYLDLTSYFINLVWETLKKYLTFLFNYNVTIIGKGVVGQSITVNHAGDGGVQKGLKKLWNMEPTFYTKCFYNKTTIIFSHYL